MMPRPSSNAGRNNFPILPALSCLSRGRGNCREVISACVATRRSRGAPWSLDSRRFPAGDAAQYLLSGPRPNISFCTEPRCDQQPPASRTAVGALRGGRGAQSHREYAFRPEFGTMLLILLGTSNQWSSPHPSWAQPS